MESSSAVGDLRGQVALVTGGGRGIGRGIARCLAEAGVTVAIVGRSAGHLAETVGLIEAAGGQALALTADVTDRPAVERAVETAHQCLGPIDLLVNNAASVVIAPIWDADPDEWWRCVEVNLRGTFLCTRAVLPSMMARRRSRIVTIVSNAAYGDLPYLSAYASGKIGMVRFSSSLAAETREHGLSAFAVEPGGVATEMQEYVAAVPSPEWRRWRDANPPPQFIPAERAGQLIVTLASGVLDTLSGRVIAVHDNLDDLVRRADEIVDHDLYAVRRRS